MIERLKAAYYRRKFGPERAALILRTERELGELRAKDLSPEWLDWLWKLPEDGWLEAIEIRRARIRLLSRREEAVKSITAKNRLASMLVAAEREGHETLDSLREKHAKAALDVEVLKTEIRDEELQFRLRVMSHLERCGSPPSERE